MDRDREEWTEEDERDPEGDPGAMPVQEEGLAVNLDPVDEQDPDIDPKIAEEVALQQETREAGRKHGSIEDAVEDPADEE